MKKLCLSIALLVIGIIAVSAGRPLRVLAIGNSFSVDALEQEMIPVARSAGQDMVIGNLYIGGCSVDTHYDNLVNDREAYSYRKFGTSSNTVDTIENCRLRYALLDEEWDVITFQQASHFSGKYDTYSHLPALIKGVRDIVGDNPRFFWHQTWAYSPESSHGAFVNYGSDQMQMYGEIIDTLRRILTENPQLVGVIPTGTAIQNARGTSLGRDLTRDGYHLSYEIGRYIASCTWYGVLFNRPATEITYYPGDLSAEQYRIAREAAQDALIDPLQLAAGK